MTELAKRAHSTAIVPHKGLTQQQQLFALEYLIDFSPRDAAIRAGFPPAASSRLMNHPPLKVHIARAIAERSRRVGLNADRILAELGKLAFGDIRNIFDQNGKLKNPAEIDPDDAALIVGVKTRRVLEQNPDDPRRPIEVEIQEIRTVDKTAVVSLAMKHLGLLNEKIDVTVTTLAERMRSADARINGGQVQDAEIVSDSEDRAFIEAGASDFEDVTELTIEDVV